MTNVWSTCSTQNVNAKMVEVQVSHYPGTSGRSRETGRQIGVGAGDRLDSAAGEKWFSFRTMKCACDQTFK